MQTIYDFEKRLCSAKDEIIAILAGERAKEQGTTLQSAIYVCGRCQSASAAIKKPKPVTRKERAVFNAAVKILEERALIEWVGQSYLKIEPADFNLQFINRYFAEGAEQKVFLKKDGKTVVKINTGYFHATWLDFFNRMILHAALFPEVSYSLIGFIVKDEKFCAVIEQPWIEAVRGATPNEVENYITQLGFTHSKYCDYYNKEHSILLEDLHDENVLIGINNNLLFVDPVIYWETPDLGLGGNTPFYFPF